MFELCIMNDGLCIFSAPLDFADISTSFLFRDDISMDKMWYMLYSADPVGQRNMASDHLSLKHFDVDQFLPRLRTLRTYSRIGNAGGEKLSDPIVAG